MEPFANHRHPPLCSLRLSGQKRLFKVAKVSERIKKSLKGHEGLHENGAVSPPTLPRILASVS